MPQILARIWGIDDHRLETRAVDMHITRLRTKLSAGNDETAPPGEWITTVRGKGYMLASGVEVTRRDAATEANS